MKLTLSQVAQLFDVSENTVAAWVREENLPAEVVNTQYRFQRAELLEWAALKKLSISPSVFRQVNGDEIGELSLADALEYGGVMHNVLGNDKATVLTAALSDIPLPKGFDRATLLELILARESLCSTGVGDGIAVPHPRYPVILAVPQPAVRLCFLAQPLDFHASDGKPVDKLFIMICPTVHSHLQLLALLASALRDESLQAALAAQGPPRQILDVVRQLERSLHQPEASRAPTPRASSRTRT